MKTSVKEYIDSIKKEGHTKAYFRFEGYGDNAVMGIEDFLYEFIAYTVGLNGEFITPQGKTLHSCFIKHTG